MNANDILTALPKGPEINAISALSNEGTEEIVFRTEIDIVSLIAIGKEIGKEIDKEIDREIDRETDKEIAIVIDSEREIVL